MTFKELIDVFLEYKKKRVKDSTFYLYNILKKYLLDYFDDNIDIKTINTMQLQFFLDNVCSKHKHSTNIGIFNFLKSILFFAENFGFLEENKIKIKKIELVSKRKTIEDIIEDKEKKNIIYTLSDLDNIFSKIKKVKFEEKFIFYLGLQTGMRVGEILALNWNDIDFKENTIEITKNYLKNVKILDIPKTLSSIRKIYISDEIKEVFKKIKYEQNQNKLKYGKEYIKYFRNKKEVDFIFRKENGEQITYNTLLNTLKKIKRIDKNFHFHKLRHSFCSQYIQQGVDVLHIAKIMGHASMNTTLKIYTHIKNDEIIHIMQKTKIM